MVGWRDRPRPPIREKVLEMLDNEALKLWEANMGVKGRRCFIDARQSPEELEDAFARDLKFGTGGLRGKVGIGPNRLNVWTVGKATQGLANYLNSVFDDPSVVIAHDSRRGGVEFARRAAEVLAANSIRAYLFDGVASTPELVFAVRDLGCSAGICITASHNPAEYNGYKVYNSNGCQITTAAAQIIQESIDAVNTFEGVRTSSYEDAVVSGLIQPVENDARTRYLDSVYKELTRADCANLSVAYTALNGTGSGPVLDTLARAGVGRVEVVAEQARPDGEFPTCPKPNPEEPEAMRLVIELAARSKCDLALATDPDADRVGVAVRHGDGYRLLTGNEVGELLMDWLLSRAAAEDRDIARLVCVTTVVSAPRADAIARLYGCQLRRTLTGFKFIGEQVGLLEEAEEPERFLFGLEESCGYLKGSYVRDKDGVEALALVCEMAADYQALGMDLVEALDDLGRRVGFQGDRQVVRVFEGADGPECMAALMRVLRDEPPAMLAGIVVDRVVDYAPGAVMPAVNPLLCDFSQQLPSTNMVEWLLADDARVLIRPSGTEPKLKIYCFATGKTNEDACVKVNQIANAAGDLLDERTKLLK